MVLIHRFSMKVEGQIGGLLVILLILFGSGQPVAAHTCTRDIAQTTTKLIRLFSTSELSADTAKELIGHKGSIERHGAYWQLRSNSSREEILLHSQRMDESADEAELRLKLESGLVLGDLERAFGPWQLVFASKTSSVRFRVAGREDKTAFVFVRLFTPNPLPSSPVLSVQLRRDKKAADGKAR